MLNRALALGYCISFIQFQCMNPNVSKWSISISRPKTGKWRCFFLKHALCEWSVLQWSWKRNHANLGSVASALTFAISLEASPSPSLVFSSTRLPPWRSAPAPPPSGPWASPWNSYWIHQHSILHAIFAPARCASSVEIYALWTPLIFQQFYSWPVAMMEGVAVEGSHDGRGSRGW